MRTATITQSRKKVALLVPADNETVVATPDFRARHKRHFPDSEMKKRNFAELLIEERGVPIFHFKTHHTADHSANNLYCSTSIP